MKKFFNLLVLPLLAITFAVTSCSPSEPENPNNGSNNNGVSEEEQPAEVSLTIDPTELIFDQTGSDKQFTITSNSVWSITKTESWVTLSRSIGNGNAQITVTAAANDTPDERTATLTIKAGDKTKTLTVTQKQKDALTVTKSSFEVSADGEKITVEVKANIDYQYEIAEDSKAWIIPSPSTRGLTTTTLQFNIAPNTVTDTREGKITIKSGGITETITVNQAAADATLAVDLKSLVYNQAGVGDPKSFKITSNTDWTIEENATWITLSKTSGSGETAITVNVTANATTDERSAVLTVKAGDKTETVTVTQKQKDALTVTKSKFEVSADGETISIEVKANIDFNYEISETGKSWITPNVTRAMQTHTLKFVIAKNEIVSARQATITFKSGSLSEVITVAQIAATPILTITKKQYDVSADGETIVIEVNANIDYQIATPPSWITLAPTTQASNTHSYIVGKNSTTNPRQTQISVYNHTYNKNEIVTISQQANILENVLRTVNVPAKGTLAVTLLENGLTDAVYLKITGDVSWDVDINTTLHNMSNSNKLRYLDISELDISTLPSYAFSKWRLNVIVLPKTLTEISDNMFYQCSLQSIEIPDGVTSIGVGAFDGCLGLSSIKIPNNVTEIKRWTFNNCGSLTSVKMPQNVTAIGDNAFYGCSSLSSIEFSDSVRTIGEYAFYECTGLTSINLPTDLMMIGDFAFRNCKSLISITSSANANPTTIGTYAFAYCHALTSVELPAKLESIGMGAFKWASPLTAIEIPASVSTIGIAAFTGCRSLETITFEKGSVLKEIDGGHDDTIERWTRGTFDECISLTSIEIPASVEAINGRAFYNCSSLETVTFEQGSKANYVHGFGGCESLSTFDASNCKMLLGVGGFESSALTIFKIGTETPPLTSGIIAPKNTVLRVPANSIEAYGKSQWIEFFPIIGALTE